MYSLLLCVYVVSVCQYKFANSLVRKTALMTQLCLEEIVSTKYCILEHFCIVSLSYCVFVPSPTHYISYARDTVEPSCAESAHKHHESTNQTFPKFFFKYFYFTARRYGYITRSLFPGSVRPSLTLVY